MRLRPAAKATGVDLSIQVGEKFAFLYQPFRHKGLYGGRGSGKSHAMGEAIVVLSSQRNLRIVCARQFQNSIRDSSKSLIEAKIKSLGLSKQFWIGKSEIRNKKTGSRFTFIGLDRNPDSARSLEGCDICWVEEARNISADALEMLIPTVRKAGSEIWWSWNPVYSTDPVDDFLRGKNPPEDSRIVYAAPWDNPWFYSTEMPAEMERMRLANYKRFQHVWLGYYDDLRESRIFQNVKIGRVEVPETVRPQFGMDFGFARDPNALIKLYVIEDRRIIYIAREAFGNVSLRDLPAFMGEVSESGKYTIVADSSRPETIDYLNGEDFTVVASRKGAGSIKAGIEWLQGYTIVIDPDCHQMREEARLYTWQVDRRTNKILDIPIDDNNHGWDAIRYATEENRSGDGVQVVTARW